MSKMDDMRALREARYAAAKPQARKSVAAPKMQPQTSTRTDRAASLPEPSAQELCGHRAISGRTCTRDKGHSAKSHRYS